MNQKEIELLKQKDSQTFTKFYEKYNKLFFHIIYKIIKDFETSEELLQDTFVKIINSIDQYKGGNFKYWCVVIAKNIANDKLRSIITERKETDEYIKQINEFTEENIYDQSLLNLEEEIFNQYSFNELLSDMKNIVDNETYEIILLHCIENMKFKDIAEQKNKTTSQVLGKYKRGVDKLRKELKCERYKKIFKK